jgi:hypothetical protein
VSITLARYEELHRLPGAAEVFCFQDEVYLCLGLVTSKFTHNVLARRINHRAKVCELCTPHPRRYTARMTRPTSVAPM